MFNIDSIVRVGAFMRLAVLFVLCAAVFQVASAYDDPPVRPPDGPGAPNWIVVGARPGSAEGRQIAEDAIGECQKTDLIARASGDVGHH